LIVSDESSFADDLKYARYYARFREIFPEIEGIEMIYLPGDNDIGGEGSEMVKPSKVKRFNNYFENRSVYRLKHKLNLYHINRIIHEMPMLSENDAEQVQENSGYTRVFISHFSVVLTPGAFSYKALQRFKPHVCFTGHYHKSSQITSEINKMRFSSTTLFLSHTMTYDLRTIEANQEILEIQVPSCSYRMGEKHIGFGQAVFENGYLHYTPLFIVNRFTQFKMYVVFGFILILVNVLISRNLRNVLRRLKLLRQNYHMI
jgi:ethanolamine phosphate phosphodiesterase